ncbi:MAG: holdfast anchoring protein HfaA [Hyphomonadaceae bacterium]
MTKLTPLSTRLATLLIGATALTGFSATAQTSDFERPIGFGFGEENRPFEPGTRDVNGNRLIVDGRIITGDDLSSFSTNSLASGGQSLSGAGFFNQPQGQTSAIGNQLNVITEGSFNTVIVNSNQTNNGDQTAILNGELDLND